MLCSVGKIATSGPTSSSVWITLLEVLYPSHPPAATLRSAPASIPPSSSRRIIASLVRMVNRLVLGSGPLEILWTALAAAYSSETNDPDAIAMPARTSALYLSKNIPGIATSPWNENVWFCERPSPSKPKRLATPG